MSRRNERRTKYEMSLKCAEEGEEEEEEEEGVQMETSGERRCRRSGA